MRRNDEIRIDWVEKRNKDSELGQKKKLEKLKNICLIYGREEAK